MIREPRISSSRDATASGDSWGVGDLASGSAPTEVSRVGVGRTWCGPSARFGTRPHEAIPPQPRAGESRLPSWRARQTPPGTRLRRDDDCPSPGGRPRTRAGHVGERVRERGFIAEAINRASSSPSVAALAASGLPRPRCAAIPFSLAVGIPKAPAVGEGKRLTRYIHAKPPARRGKQKPPENPSGVAAHCEFTASRRPGPVKNCPCTSPWRYLRVPPIRVAHNAPGSPFGILRVRVLHRGNSCQRRRSACSPATSNMRPDIATVQGRRPHLEPSP